MKTNAICKHTSADELEIHYTDSEMTQGRGMILLDMKLLRQEGVKLSDWIKTSEYYADFDEASRREIGRVYDLAIRNPQ